MCAFLHGNKQAKPVGIKNLKKDPCLFYFDFWTQAISDSWDEYDQEETTALHVLRRTESGQNNRTSMGCNVEGGGVGGNQGPK